MPASNVVVRFLPYALHHFVSDKLFQNDEVTNSTVESNNLIGHREEIEQLPVIGKVSKSSGGGIVRSCGMEPEGLFAKVDSRLIGGVQKSMQRIVKITTPSVKADALHKTSPTSLVVLRRLQKHPYHFLGGLTLYLLSCPLLRTTISGTRW